VGASQTHFKGSTMFMLAILEAGYEGKVFPVNPKANEIAGLKAFPTVSAIPDDVDYVIIGVPRQFVLGAIEDCVRKRVKAVHIFSAGFSEIGDKDWTLVEKEIAEKAQQGGVRIIGPNCIGISSPWAKIPLGPGEWTLPEAGSIGVVCQSGGILRKWVEIGWARKIKFSKMVSFGNACDLDGLDFIDYMAMDSRTSTIGAYLEGVKDGRRLLEIGQKIKGIKPMVIWKGGRTEAGSKVARSHTASLAAFDGIWSSVLAQIGAIRVEGLEEMTDLLLAFQELPAIRRPNIAILTGLADGGGGDSVASVDVCSGLGLKVPSLLPETVKNLQSIKGIVSNILDNPVDLNLGPASISVVKTALDLVCEDSNVDLVIILMHVVSVLTYRSKEEALAMNDVFIQKAREKK